MPDRVVRHIRQHQIRRPAQQVHHLLIVVRMAWVLGYNGVSQTWNRIAGRQLCRNRNAPSFASGLVDRRELALTPVVR